MENAAVTDSWTAVSRIAAAATAMTMATTQATTKLRMDILQFVEVLIEFSETHSRMVARNSQGLLQKFWMILRYNILTDGSYAALNFELLKIRRVDHAPRQSGALAGGLPL